MSVTTTAAYLTSVVNALITDNESDKPTAYLIIDAYQNGQITLEEAVSDINEIYPGIFDKASEVGVTNPTTDIVNLAPTETWQLKNFTGYPNIPFVLNETDLVEYYEWSLSGAIQALSDKVSNIVGLDTQSETVVGAINEIANYLFPVITRQGGALVFGGTNSWNNIYSALGNSSIANLGGNFTQAIGNTALSSGMAVDATTHHVSLSSAIGGTSIANVVTGTTHDNLAGAIGNTALSTNFLADDTTGVTSLSSAIGSTDISGVNGAGGTDTITGIIGTTNITGAASTITGAIGSTDIDAVSITAAIGTAPISLNPLGGGAQTTLTAGLNAVGAAIGIHTITDVTPLGSTGPTTLSDGLHTIASSIGLAELNSVGLRGTTPSQPSSIKVAIDNVNAAIGNGLLLENGVGAGTISGVIGTVVTGLLGSGGKTIAAAIGNTDISGTASTLSAAIGSTDINAASISAAIGTAAISLNPLGGGAQTTLAAGLNAAGAAIGTTSTSSVVTGTTYDTLAGAIGNTALSTNFLADGTTGVASISSAIGSSDISSVVNGTSHDTLTGVIGNTALSTVGIQNDTTTGSPSITSAIGSGSISNLGYTITAALGNTYIGNIGASLSDAIGSSSGLLGSSGKTISAAIGATSIASVVTGTTYDTLAGAIGNTALSTNFLADGTTGVASISSAIGSSDISSVVNGTSHDTLTGVIGNTALSTHLLADGTTGATSLSSAIGSSDISRVSSSDDNSITGVIGNAALTTTAQTLSDAINEVKSSVGTAFPPELYYFPFYDFYGAFGYLGSGQGLLGNYSDGYSSLSLSQAIGTTALTGFPADPSSTQSSLSSAIGSSDISGVNGAGGTDTITGIIGNTALTTTTQTLSGAISELRGALGSTTSGFGHSGVWSSVNAAIGTTDISGTIGATHTLTGEIATLSTALGAATFGNGGVSVNTLLGTTNISNVASTITGAIGNTAIRGGDGSLSGALAALYTHVNGQVISADINDGTITTADISPNAGITGGQIAANTIHGSASGTNNLAAGTITSADISSTAGITPGQLAASYGNNNDGGHYALDAIIGSTYIGGGIGDGSITSAINNLYTSATTLNTYVNGEVIVSTTSGFPTTQSVTVNAAIGDLSAATGTLLTRTNTDSVAHAISALGGAVDSLNTYVTAKAAVGDGSGGLSHVTLNAAIGDLSTLGPTVFNNASKQTVLAALDAVGGEVVRLDGLVTNSVVVSNGADGSTTSSVNGAIGNLYKLNQGAGSHYTAGNFFTLGNTDNVADGLAAIGAAIGSGMGGLTGFATDSYSGPAISLTSAIGSSDISTINGGTTLDTLTGVLGNSALSSSVTRNGTGSTVTYVTGSTSTPGLSGAIGGTPLGRDITKGGLANTFTTVNGGTTTTLSQAVGNVPLGQDVTGTYTTVSGITAGSESITNVIGTTPLGGLGYTADSITGHASISSILSQVSAAGWVTTTRIADNTILNAKIADGAISGAKIADGAITATQLAIGSVTTNQISNGAVTSGKQGFGSWIVGGTDSWNNFVDSLGVAIFGCGNDGTIGTASSYYSVSAAAPGNGDHVDFADYLAISGQCAAHCTTQAGLSNCLNHFFNFA